MTYQDNPDNLTPDQLQGFFQGWPNPPSPETHLKLLKNSDHVFIALDNNQVVGFITAITDHTLCAYIPLLEVLPSHQKQHIGKELMQRMLKKLEDLYMVDLVCDPVRVGFYASFGLKPLTALGRRNYERQSGE
jgi:ribosomal protein S18 acetylase RimI-like enzyme